MFMDGKKNRKKIKGPHLIIPVENSSEEKVRRSLLHDTLKIIYGEPLPSSLEVVKMRG